MTDAVRYRLDGYDAGMTPAHDGVWVRLCDYAATCAALVEAQAEVARLTAELVTARDEGRREGLEAAARVAEHRHNEWQRLGSACLVDDDISACADIAIAIRALIGGDGNG